MISSFAVFAAMSTLRSVGSWTLRESEELDPRFLSCRFFDGGESQAMGETRRYRGARLREFRERKKSQMFKCMYVMCLENVHGVCWCLLIEGK